MSGSAGGRCSGMRSSSLTAAADLDMAFVPSPGHTTLEDDIEDDFDVSL